MGIKTVAVYSDPDASAVHVRAADEAICIGPAPSSESYLRIPRIMNAIARSGAQAVHPGCGFLSENAGFVGELERAGITFIGPNAYAMNALGDKIHSKGLAAKAGVNTVPGFVGEVPTQEDAVRIARDIGYPVMIKASSGGGGKGMRIAWNDEEVRLGFRLSKEEARSAFGTDRLLVEKYIQEPRHIEIQLIADSHGNVVPLPERECSVQRRNQKVIEESPSVHLDEKTRRAMQGQAAALAASVGYTSAGTVEFLVDAKRNFYFLEMNTRLQVEHPITEMVTGLDLVELMIRVAAGERLPPALTGGHVPINGWAFESRVYAEDPLRGFLPSTGRLSVYAEPAAAADRDPYISGSAVRADAGVSQGSEISMFYDPMICKLITHGPDRASALDLQRAALDDYVIRGVGHNVAFLRSLVDHPRFCEGRLSTAFIPEEFPAGFKGVQLDAAATHRLVAAATLMHMVREYAGAEISGRASSARASDVSQLVVTIGVATSSVPNPPTFNVGLRLEPSAGSSHLTDGGVAVGDDLLDESLWAVDITPVHVGDVSAAATATVRVGALDWTTDSPLFIAALPDTPAAAPQSARTLRVQHLDRLHGGFRLQMAGAVADVYVRSPSAAALARHMLPKRERDVSRHVLSPMPGVLVSLSVEVGDAVEEGQEVAIIEAMKMRNVLRAPKRGRVSLVPVKVGATLAVDQTIVEFQ